MKYLELSVVIPTHNRKELLREELLSLSNPKLFDTQMEVIVVVDGGSDGTWEMLQELSLPYTLRPINQLQSGPSVARNNGARAAKGDVLIFLDDDLLPKQELIDEHMAFHFQDPHAVVLGRLLPADKGDKGGWNVWEEQILEKHYKAMSSGHRPPAGRRLYSGNFSVRKQAFLDAGGFDEELKRGEDVDLGFRLEEAGNKFHFNSEAAAIHRGYRSFASWCKSSYLYGRCDVELALNRGHKKEIAEVMRWYHRKPFFARRAISLSAGRPAIVNAMTQALHKVSGMLTKMRLKKLARYGYSAIYQLQYWHGVTEALGGRQTFFQYLQLWRTNELVPMEGKPEVSYEK